MILKLRTIVVPQAGGPAGELSPIPARHPWRVMAAVLLTLLFLFFNRPASGAELSDSHIRRSIGKHVVSETAVTQDQVDIKVNKGIVILSGSVNNLLQKKWVREIAESIRGVRSVIDTVVVRPVIRENGAIAKDVRDSLSQITPDRGFNASVAVDGGIVTLKGEADSWVLSRFAAYQAMSIKGVSEVINRIVVKPRLQRDDKDIASDIDRRLAADLYVDDANIEVTVKDGRAKLQGTVGTAAEKRRAADNAWVNGVVSVDERQLMVEWGKNDHMRRASPHIRQSDQTILKAVKDALLMDPRVNAANPDVSVVNGAVTLSGVVETLYAKKAAAEDARSTTGVWKVKNQLRLRGRSLPQDHQVKGMIENAFQRDAELHALDIDIAVNDHQVKLSGMVDTMGRKIRAENIATQIEGVLTLDNRISVKAKRETLSDTEIAADIMDELFWSPYVDSDRIGVTVKNGQAALIGTAASRFAAHAAVQNAFEGGAKTVQTKLVLDDGSVVAELYRAESYRFLPNPILSFLP